MVGLQQIAIPISWIYNGERRFDASYYASDVIAANVLVTKIENRGFRVLKCSDFAKQVFWPGRFKRSYVSTGKGEPFYTASEVFLFYNKPRKFIMNYPKNVLVKKKYILITRSGSVGRVIIANKYLENVALSDDLIRIIPSEDCEMGYLYAFLNTWMGQALLTKDQYGATVKHIEPHHIASIPIPILGEIREKVNTQIEQAHFLREEAQGLLLSAMSKLQNELGLQEISNRDANYLNIENSDITKCFSINASKLCLRFDGSYHNPLAQAAVQYLQGLTKTAFVQTLDSVLMKAFVPPRFKRLYVDGDLEGVPMLQGTHIPLIKPQNIKYIWRQMKDFAQYTVNKNWILITCSGTIGKTSLVSKFWDGWTATNHILRLVPNEQKIDPGFLTAFLLSQYGQLQLQRLIYGGVVDEIGEAGELFNRILIVKPKDARLEKEIGALVYNAYLKRDAATQLENNAIKQIEAKLEDLRND